MYGGGDVMGGWRVVVVMWWMDGWADGGGELMAGR